MGLSTLPSPADPLDEDQGGTMEPSAVDGDGCDGDGCDGGTKQFPISSFDTTSEPTRSLPARSNAKHQEEKVDDRLTDDVIDVVAQRLKFFFSDANLRHDHFLRKLLWKNKKNNNGVPVSTLMRFKSIEAHTTNAQVLVDAVQRHLSDTLELEWTGHQHLVKRVRTFTREHMQGHVTKTLVIGNLPKIDFASAQKHPHKKKGNKKTENEENDETTSNTTCAIRQLVQDLESLFKPYGAVAMVKLQQNNSNIYVPKGFCQVEFEEERALQAAAAHVLTSKRLLPNRENTTTTATTCVVTPNRALQIQGKSLTVSLLKDIMAQHCFDQRVKLEEYNRLAQQEHMQAAAQRRRLAMGCGMELAKWKNLPFCTGQPAFCYKLKIIPQHSEQQTKSEKGAIQKASLWHQDVSLGLLLPIDLWEFCSRAFHETNTSKDPFFEASFNLPFKPGVVDNHTPWKVRLSEKSYVEPNGFSDEQLAQLRHFQRVLLNWKNYGVGRDKELDETMLYKLQEAPNLLQEDAFASTCLFVPIIEARQSAGYQIDWNMIDQEVRRETTSLMEQEVSWRTSVNKHDDNVPFLDFLSQSHVLLHRNIRHRLVGTSDLTALSPFPSQVQDLTETKINNFLRRHQLDLRTATYADYFEKRYAMHVKCFDKNLLTARTVRSLGDENWYLNIEEQDESNVSEAQENRYVHLIPEFVEILPVPLPLLFTMSLVPYFMPALEREVDLSAMAHNFQLGALHRTDGKNNNHSNLSMEKYSRNILVDDKSASDPRVPFVGLLREATTLFPAPTYDRLEFLGDSVLGYFLALNVIACNTSLDWTGGDGGQNGTLLDVVWDSEDMNEHISIAVRNVALAEAAKQMQLENLLYRQLHFKSAYLPEDKQSKRQRMNEIPNKTLSDCVESLLCAAFLADEAKNESVVVYILSLLKLPFPMRNGDKRRWFKASGAALNQCYPIHTNFHKNISRIFDILQATTVIRDRLDQGVEQLRGILATSSGKEKRLPPLDSNMHILLQCALFDDDLMQEEENCGSIVDFLPLVLLRENLYVIGAFALQLMISKEFYERFEKANSNDLHMLRACAMNDDVLAYIMVKNGIHNCLYDLTSECVSLFVSKVQQAEKMADERRQERLASGCNGSSTVDMFTVKKYPGLAGGRLMGSESKKLSGKYTGELMFSFKCIVGSLTLSFGEKEMWGVISCLFDELLAMSPEMIRRQYFDESTLVKTYSLQKK
ncbi:hypothetical protein ACA910_022124 [Epithemia clementina (nom. ined.)]